MSGGGSKVAKGRIGCKVVSDVTPQELAAIERELEQRRSDATEKREKLKQLEEEMETLDKDLKEMNLTHKKQTMDIKVRCEVLIDVILVNLKGQYLPCTHSHMLGSHWQLL